MPSFSMANIRNASLRRFGAGRIRPDLTSLPAFSTGDGEASKTGKTTRKKPNWHEVIGFSRPRSPRPRPSADAPRQGAVRRWQAHPAQRPRRDPTEAGGAAGPGPAPKEVAIKRHQGHPAVPVAEGDRRVGTPHPYPQPHLLQHLPGHCVPRSLSGPHLAPRQFPVARQVGTGGTAAQEHPAPVMDHRQRHQHRVRRTGDILPVHDNSWLRIGPQNGGPGMITGPREGNGCVV